MNQIFNIFTGLEKPEILLSILPVPRFKKHCIFQTCPMLFDSALGPDTQELTSLTITQLFNNRLLATLLPNSNLFKTIFPFTKVLR